MSKFMPDEYSFVPKSYNMPQDEDALKAYMKKHPNKTFICKPNEGSEGCGILLAKKFKDIP